MSDEMTKMYQRHANLKDKQRYLAQLPIALVGDVNCETERDQLAELSRTLPIEEVREILNSFKKHPQALPKN